MSFVKRTTAPTKSNKYYTQTKYGGYSPCILGNTAKIPRAWAGCVLPNCFSGDTEYITIEGLKTFRDTVGTIQQVLNENGEFVPAEIQSFGQQEIYELILGNNDPIYTTANHRWVVDNISHHENVTYCKRKIKMTEDLIKRDGIPYNYYKGTTELDPAGIQHGLVFGDGKKCHCGNTYELNWYTDKKKALEQYLTRPIYGKYNLKQLPPLTESDAYLRGFVAGWLATDGTVTKDTFKISNVNFDNIKGLETICYKIGIPISRIVSETRDKRIGNYFYPQHTMYALTLRRKNIETLLINPFDQQKLTQPSDNIQYTHIKSLRKTNRIEEVYCAIEPITHTFTLKRNILTGNCVGGETSRFNEIGGYKRTKYLGNTNACNFVKLAQSQGLTITQTPSIGACIVWSGGDSNCGHVASVEDIISDTEIVVGESGWSSSKLWWTATHRRGDDGQWTDGDDKYWMKNKYQFLGFIKHPAISDDYIPTLSQGSRGMYVIDLQTNLNELGSSLVVDGHFGALTTYAVKTFQKNHGLTVDGSVGPATQAAIQAALMDARKPEGVSDLELLVDNDKFTVWSTVIAEENYIRLRDLPKLGLCAAVEWDEKKRMPKIVK